MLRFLVNPTSGGGRVRRHLPALRRRAAALGAEVEVSSSGVDLTARARRAVAEGVERLVVAGGDGSMHLAVQALAGSECALAVVPCGRGDDLAGSIGVPDEFGAALDIALDGDARTIDLGRVGERWFVLYGGGGFDAACTRTAAGQPRWWPDDLTYSIAVLRTVRTFRPPLVAVEWAGGSWEGEAMFVTACNAPRFGGGMQIAPGADLADGVLELVIVRALSKRRLLFQVFPRVFSGNHVHHPAVRIHRTPWARVRFAEQQIVGCDGELVAELEGRPLEFTAQPNMLRVIGTTG